MFLSFYTMPPLPIGYYRMGAYTHENLNIVTNTLVFGVVLIV